MTTGLVMLEVYKIVAGLPIEQIRSSNFNLAVNHYAFFEPMEAEKTKYRDTEFTLWDTIDIDAREMTLQDLLDHFEEELNFEVSMVSTMGSNPVCLFSFFMSDAVTEPRLEQSVLALVEDVTKRPVPPSQLSVLLDIAVDDPDDEDAEIDIPPVRLTVR